MTTTAEREFDACFSSSPAEQTLVSAVPMNANGQHVALVFLTCWACLYVPRVKGGQEC